MRFEFLLLVNIAVAMVVTGYGIFHVEAGFKQPAEMAATEAKASAQRRIWVMATNKRQGFGLSRLRASHPHLAVS